MRCGRPANVTTVLIGLHQVGVVGLRDALRRVLEAGITDREALVDRVLELLAEDNYIPDSQGEAYRLMVWRESLRMRGEDLSEFYSDVEVAVRGPAGTERDRFVERITAVFAEFELKPAIRYLEPDSDDPTPELVIEEETVVHGLLPHDEFKAAVRRRISDW